MGKAKTLAQKIADLDGPLTKDFDPEEDRPALDSDEESGSGESDDEDAGTEHYAKIGKSRLRKPEEIALGPKYSGSRVTREALLHDDSDENDPDSVIQSEDSEDGQFANPDDSDLDIDGDDADINSEDAIGESDMESFKAKGFTFRGSSRPVEPASVKKRPTAADFMSDSEKEDLDQGEERSHSDETDADILDFEDQHTENSEGEVDSSGHDEESENEMDEDESETSGEDSEDDSEDDDDEEKAKRAELRKIMNEEKKSVVTTISQAAKADTHKGNAVKQQRKDFGSLLNLRMGIQKALVATNSMATVDEKSSGDALNQPYEAAEEAAMKLWNTLDSLRHQLCKVSSGSMTGQKRKRDLDISASSSAIWERMQSSEVAAINTRQTTLEKWSSKVKGTTAVPLIKKFNQSAGGQSIMSMLQDQLANSDHLIRKTKIPRSCAPIQRDAKLTEDPNIYDDGNFYQMLLKELIDQRRADSLAIPAAGTAGNATQWTAVKEAKTRKNVDTKASKGRKMRFTVHEKLQNFMAPEDRRSWESSAIDNLFGTLLGQKMNLVEDDTHSDVETDDEIAVGESGLKLFA